MNLPHHTEICLRRLVAEEHLRLVAVNSFAGISKRRALTVLPKV